MNKQLAIFVDADAFVATVKESDTTHKKALKLLDILIQQSAMLITSNYVISETITVISQRVGHVEAVIYIEQMQSGNNLFLINRVDEEIEEEAIEIFKKQTSKNTSFVDCVNMAFMRQHNIDVIFSFDQIYRKNGFKLVKDLVREV